MEGRRLDDRWEVGAPIASGASSVVYEGVDRTSGDRVAIKCVNMEAAGWRGEVRDRFRQEVKLLAMVQVENVVRVRGYGETDDGFLFLVLDRLDGETLDAFIAREAPIAWRRAAILAGDLARGCAALHARGIVHRDLKPANVILHREGDRVVPKIIDLGIGKAKLAIDPSFVTLTATGQVLGTPEYMSAEQARGDRDVDARGDVWALGVILYEMIAARRPFDGPNVNAVLAAIRARPIEPLRARDKSVPRSIDVLVARCLDRDRDARLADAGALSSAIDAALREVDRRAREMKIAGVAIAIAVLAAAGAIALSQLRTTTPAALPSSTPFTTAEPSSNPTSAIASAPLPPVSPPIPAPAASPARARVPPEKSSRAVRTRVDDAGF